MRKGTILFIALLTFGELVLSAQESFIQVVAEPNISVFIDGVFKGSTTSEMEGLIIDNLAGGTYRIKVVKDGFIPQEESIVIKNGEVRQYFVQPFIPEVTIRQQGDENQQTIERKTGNLKIQSIPVEINIKIQNLGIDSDKTQDEWYADSVNIGSYDAMFTWNSNKRSFEIPILEGKETSLLVNMFSGELEFRGETAKELNSLMQEEKLREKKLDEKQQQEQERLAEAEREKEMKEIEKPKTREGELIDSRDQHDYKTIVIGNQTWMAENLQYDSRRNRYYKQGMLYYWFEALEVCPDGWHLPSDEEWKELEMYLGMSAAQANKTKERGSDEGYKLKDNSWEGEDNNMGNEIGFLARPDGWFGYPWYSWGTPEFKDYGKRTRFWTSTQVKNKIVRNAWYRELNLNSGQIWREYSICSDFSAYYVRCAKD